MLTAGGAHQPYLFSTHVRSDEYADASLRHFARLGATKVTLLHESDDDYFYRGLGERIVEYASELQLELTHVSALSRAADGTADLAAFEAQLLANTTSI